MSIIHVRHIKTALLARLKDHVDLSDCTTDDAEERQRLLLTRALAAYSISLLAGVEPAAAASAVVDGFGDNGIDAVYFDPTERKLYVVQSKWMANGFGSPALGDVQKFIAGFRDLLDGKFDRFTTRLQARQAEILEAISDAST